MVLHVYLLIVCNMRALKISLNTSLMFPNRSSFGNSSYALLYRTLLQIEPLTSPHLEAERTSLAVIRHAISGAVLTNRINAKSLCCSILGLRSSLVST